MVSIKQITFSKLTVMNNAKSFIQNHLKGLSITFKPIEKGKDRPVQTMTFTDFQQGQYGIEVYTTIKYTTRNSTTPTVATRWLSLARVMEYVAQAAEQTYVDDEQLPTASPAQASATEVVDLGEPEVEAPKQKKGKWQGARG